MVESGNQSFSIQAQLIREMQAKEGREPCYGTPVAAHCSKSVKEQCSWRHDCFHEAEEQDEGWSEDDGQDMNWIDGATYRCGSEFS